MPVLHVGRGAVEQLLRKGPGKALLRTEQDKAASRTTDRPRRKTRQWLVKAARLANGTRPYGRATERVPQDVQLGYWLSRHPSLRYVSLPRKTGWADAFVEVTDLRRLLVAHRVPWDQLAWLTGRTESEFTGSFLC